MALKQFVWIDVRGIEWVQVMDGRQIIADDFDAVRAEVLFDAV